jgi:hypothetical protein
VIPNVGYGAMVAAADTAQVLMRKAVWKFKRLLCLGPLGYIGRIDQDILFSSFDSLMGGPECPFFSVVPLPLLREFGAKNR